VVSGRCGCGVAMVGQGDRRAPGFAPCQLLDQVVVRGVPAVVGVVATRSGTVRIAQRVGERNALRRHFGPTNIAAWRLAVGIELGEGARAYADATSPFDWPDPPVGIRDLCKSDEAVQGSSRSPDCRGQPVATVLVKLFRFVVCTATRSGDTRFSCLPRSRPFARPNFIPARRGRCGRRFGDLGALRSICTLSTPATGCTRRMRARW
jgi:hypothetical protein